MKCVVSIAVIPGPKSTGSVAMAHWLSCSTTHGSSLTRDQIHVSCIGRRILYNWSIRKPSFWTFNLQKCIIMSMCCLKSLHLWLFVTAEIETLYRKAGWKCLGKVFRVLEHLQTAEVLSLLTYLTTFLPRKDFHIDKFKLRKGPRNSH